MVGLFDESDEAGIENVTVNLEKRRIGRPKRLSQKKQKLDLNTRPLRSSSRLNQD